MPRHQLSTTHASPKFSTTSRHSRAMRWLLLTCKGEGVGPQQKACCCNYRISFSKSFWRGLFPHPLRIERRRAFGDLSGNVTWHGEGTQILLPRQLRSQASRGPASFPGWRGHRPRVVASTDEGGGKVTRRCWGGVASAAPWEAGAPGKLKAATAARSRNGRSGGHGRGAHLPRGPHGGHEAGPGPRRSARVLAVQPFSAPGRDKRRADGWARP